MALEQDAGWPVTVMYCQIASVPCMLTAAPYKMLQQLWLIGGNILPATLPGKLPAMYCRQCIAGKSRQYIARDIAGIDHYRLIFAGDCR